MQRRSFLSGILAAAAAPAIVKAQSLMPIWTPKRNTGAASDSFIWRFGVPYPIEHIEPWCEFTLMQIKAVAENLAVPIDELLRKHPVTQVQHSSARVALLEQFSKTPSIWPRDVRSNHGQFPS